LVFPDIFGYSTSSQKKSKKKNVLLKQAISGINYLAFSGNKDKKPSW